MISPETIETIKVLDLIADNKRLTQWTIHSKDHGSITIDQVGGGFSLVPFGDVLSGFETLNKLGEYPDIAKRLSRPMQKGKSSRATFYSDECQT